MVEEELKLLSRFKLDPDTTVLIQKYRCLYSGSIPVPGNLYIMNDYVCFSSFFNQKTIFGKKTKLKISIRMLILCEVVDNFGTGLRLTTSEDEGQRTYQFNNLGDDAKMANFLINDMMEGYQYKLKQQKEVDDIYIQQIE